MVIQKKLLEKPRSLLIFEASIKSEETKKAYFFSLEKFSKWANVENYGDLLKADEKSIQLLLTVDLIHK